MYKNHNSLLHNLGVISFVIHALCQEHNINTIRDINLQHLFGEHPSVLPILLLNDIMQVLNPYKPSVLFKGHR